MRENGASKMFYIVNVNTINGGWGKVLVQEGRCEAETLP